MSLGRLNDLTAENEKDKEKSLEQSTTFSTSLGKLPCLHSKTKSNMAIPIKEEPNRNILAS